MYIHHHIDTSSCKTSTCADIIMYIHHHVHTSSCTHIIMQDINMCRHHNVQTSTCAYINMCRHQRVQTSSCTDIIIYRHHHIQTSSCNDKARLNHTSMKMVGKHGKNEHSTHGPITQQWNTVTAYRLKSKSILSTIPQQTIFVMVTYG